MPRRIVGAIARRHPAVGSARSRAARLPVHPVGELDLVRTGFRDRDRIVGDIRSGLVVGAGGIVDDHLDDCVALVCRDVDGDFDLDPDLAGDRVV